MKHYQIIVVTEQTEPLLFSDCCAQTVHFAQLTSFTNSSVSWCFVDLTGDQSWNLCITVKRNKTFALLLKEIKPLHYC